MKEDIDLINDYLDGDQLSLKELIDRYTNPVYNFSSRFVKSDEVKDITQEVFIKVWKNLKKFNKNKSQFKTWVFTITRNTIIDYLRKKKSLDFSDLENDEDVPIEDTIESTLPLPDEEYDKLIDKELLNECLSKLSLDERTVLSLYYDEDMNFREIGEALNKPINTIKSYHLRAIKKLRTLCTNYKN